MYTEVAKIDDWQDNKCNIPVQLMYILILYFIMFTIRLIFMIQLTIIIITILIIIII